MLGGRSNPTWQSKLSSTILFTTYLSRLSGNDKVGKNRLEPNMQVPQKGQALIDGAFTHCIPIVRFCKEHVLDRLKYFHCTKVQNGQCNASGLSLVLQVGRHTNPTERKESTHFTGITHGDVMRICSKGRHKEMLHNGSICVNDDTHMYNRTVKQFTKQDCCNLVKSCFRGSTKIYYLFTVGV